MSFFTLFDKTPRARIGNTPHCGACGLYKTCKSPKMQPQGKGKKEILIVAETPGKIEDEDGVYGGKSKRSGLLEEAIAAAGGDLWKDCVRTSALICRPPSDRESTSKEIGYCRPNLFKAIKEHKPKTIILLGSTALSSMLGTIWSKDIGSIARWAGWEIPYQTTNTWIHPTFHPSYVQKAKGGRDKVLKMMFFHHIKRAFKHKSRPWKKVPDWSKDVELIHDPKKAAKRIKKFVELGGSVAFDYEANMLKPESKEFEILCCSICYEGKSTICFPWRGAVIPAMKKLFRAKNVRKIASNMKYEDRVTRRHLGAQIRNWAWDTMLAAHWQDSRTGITSIKFQSLVLLGMDPYDDDVDPYKEAKSGNEKNKLATIDPTKLMTYCGLDSLLEFKVAVKQGFK